jgi:hypothetical protein
VSDELVTSEWLTKIRERLRELPGSSDQKVSAVVAAIDLERALPSGKPTLDKWANFTKRMFEHWIEVKGYLNPILPPEHSLPDSVLHSDAEIAIMYELKTSRGVQEKQVYLAQAAEHRIQTALDQLEAGWDLVDIRCFLCSREEYEQVQRRFGIEHHDPRPRFAAGSLATGG